LNDSIILYHGSISDFDEIDVKLGKPYKDYGRGFYCSETKSQAVGIAIRNYNIENSKEKMQGIQNTEIQKWLYTYEFPRSETSNLSVKVFEKADRSWLRFVSENRRSAESIHNFDIVIGPTANDRTNASIQLYFAGGYGKVGTDRAMDILLEVLMPENLPEQTFFATARAAEYLMLIKKERL
jgi:hypothetical protein